MLVVFLLSGCLDSTKFSAKEEIINQNIQSSAEERVKTFIKDFSKNYSGFELLDYVAGTNENIPIQLAAIAKNKENGTSSTLFIVDSNGVGQLVLASEYFSEYRKEDGIHLSANVISISLDVEITGTSSEIHDFDIIVTQEEKQGKLNTLYTSKETIRYQRE